MLFNIGAEQWQLQANTRLRFSDSLSVQWAESAAQKVSGMIAGTKWFNVVLRALLELGIVAALGYWGYHAAGGSDWKWLLAVLIPAAGFGFWSLIDFHQAGRAAEWLRLTQELLVSGLACLAWYAAGQTLLAVALASVSLLHHALVYACGDRLLRT